MDSYNTHVASMFSTLCRAPLKHLMSSIFKMRDDISPSHARGVGKMLHNATQKPAARAPSVNARAPQRAVRGISQFLFSPLGKAVSPLLSSRRDRAPTRTRETNPDLPMKPGQRFGIQTSAAQTKPHSSPHSAPRYIRFGLITAFGQMSETQTREIHRKAVLFLMQTNENPPRVPSCSHPLPSI